MAFAKVYPYLVAKAEKKGRTKAEVHAVIYWLTGYDEQGLEQQIDEKVDYETFFARAPRISSTRNLVRRRRGELSLL